MNLAIVLVHIGYFLTYIFICFAFLDRRLAHINLYYVLPVMFVLCLVPVCPIDYIEEQVVGGETLDEARTKKMEAREMNTPYKWWMSLSDMVGNKGFATPLSATGLLIFGGVTSAYALKKK